MPIATLECSLCQTRQRWEPGESELASLKQFGAAILRCDVCGRGTFWVHSDEDRRATPERRVETNFAIGGDIAAKDRRTEEDRREIRGPRRVSLTLPIRVRGGAQGERFEELAKTSNVSRGGLFFYSERRYEVGQEVRVVMNHSLDPHANQLEQRATVVRLEPGDGPTRTGVALKFIY